MRGIPVEITLHSKQQAGEDTQVIHQQLRGTLQKTGEDFLLTYTEEDAGGFGPGQTSLCLSPGRAVMERRGKGAAQMRFVPGQRHPFEYPTPYGVLALTVETEKLLHNLAGGSGNVMLRYRLYQGEALLGRYTLTLHIKEKDEAI